MPEEDRTFAVEFYENCDDMKTERGRGVPGKNI